MADIERKSLTLELKKDGDEGTFTARIASLGQADRDGDVTLPGAFPPGKAVLVSSYQHTSWQGHVPVGKAVITEVGGAVIADGQFNLAIESGREHYEAVKFSGVLQQWSYGFRPLEWEMSNMEGKAVRLLKKIEPFEISPVLVGAGIGTATLAIKSGSSPFADHAERVLLDVTAFVERARSLADLRTKEGRDISVANRERLQRLMESLAEVTGDIKALLAAPEPKGKAAPDMRRVWGEYQRLMTNINSQT